MFHATAFPRAISSRLPAVLPTLTRRRFLFSASLVGTAMLIGCSSDEPEPAPATTPDPNAPKAGPSPFSAYVGIEADGRVVVYSSQFDMGQNAYHGLATLVAEELGVSLDQVRVEGRAGNPAWYGNLAMGGAFQLTGGSTSMATSWDRYRMAGAVARDMLLQAGAARLAVPRAEVSGKDGAVVHAASGRSTSYGSLISVAVTLPVPADVPLKTPAEWTLIGKDSTARIDARQKSTGTLPFTIDIRLPGQLFATIQHSPKFGGVVASLDDTAARAVAGVTDVVQISRGVAVVATNTWAAIQGLRALKVTWDDTAAETRSTNAIVESFEAAAKGEGKSALKRGDAAAALGKATKVIEADYRFPYLAHAALEPLNAAAQKIGDRLHLYGGLQMPDAVQGTCAAIAGVTPDAVDLHVYQTGGGFGRRAVPDSDVFVEVVEIAKAINFRAPVLLQWTREADMAGGRYRPMHVHRVRVGVAEDGSISGWQHHVVGQSIFAGSPFEAMMKDGIDPLSLEGVIDSPYRLPDIDVQVTHPKLPVPVLWWRSVGHTHTAYVMETMIDEIAESTGKDPVALRLDLLPEGARERAVLELAAAKAGWSEPVAEGRFRGVAVHASFGSFVATVAEVEKRADGGIQVLRCVVASDCGLVINPDVVRAQIEGGTGFGLGAILGEQVELADGVVVQTNFTGYRPLRMTDMPVVEAHLLPSAEKPTGIGEVAVPPIGPAVANAIFKATGKRLRHLPLRRA